MTKYPADLSRVQTLAEVEKMLASLIQNETGAEVEVTVREKLRVYTEALPLVEEIMGFLARTNNRFIGASYYDTDEDMPEGVTLTFAMPKA